MKACRPKKINKPSALEKRRRALFFLVIIRNNRKFNNIDKKDIKSVTVL